MLFQPLPKKLLISLGNYQATLISAKPHTLCVCNLIILPCERSCVVRMKKIDYFWQFSISVENILRRVVGYVDDPLKTLNTKI